MQIFFQKGMQIDTPTDGTTGWCSLYRELHCVAAHTRKSKPKWRVKHPQERVHLHGQRRHRCLYIACISVEVCLLDVVDLQSYEHGYQRCLRPWHNEDDARKITWFPLSVCCPEITLRGQRITVSLFWKSKRFGGSSLANAAGKRCRGLTMGRERRWEFVLARHYVRWKKIHNVFVIPLLLFVQVSST